MKYFETHLIMMNHLIVKVVKSTEEALNLGWPTFSADFLHMPLFSFNRQEMSEYVDFKVNSY